MKPIRLLDLGLVSPVRSQTIYHAVGHAMNADTPDTVILVAPDRPYVCIGYHQDPQQEVDLDYCDDRGLPVLRREVGGGAVYLDAGQLFVQWVFGRGSLPAGLEDRFELYIRPLVETYRAVGVAAYHRPVNDIHVAGKKIGGTGAAQMGEAEVLVGSLMFTFDKSAMARVLKVPSEKMRDKIHESLEMYMTTLEEELKPPPERAVVRGLYLERAAAVLGRDIVPGQLTPAEVEVAIDLDETFVSDEWLHQHGVRSRGSVGSASIKIHEDVQVLEGAYKTPGGLVRSIVRMRDGQIDALVLTGDFTVLPATAVDALESAATGAAFAREELAERFAHVYGSLRIEAPGLSPEDLADAVLAGRDAQPPLHPSGKAA